MSDEIPTSSAPESLTAPAAVSAPAAPEVHPTKSFIDAFLSGGPLFVSHLRDPLLSLWKEFEQVSSDRDALVTKFGDEAHAVLEEVRSAAQKI